MNAIEFKNVSFSYGEAPILNNVSFAIPEGDYAGVIGPNGGGKTTIIKIALGLLEPRSGEVLIFGMHPDKFPGKSHIGYVPQKAGQPNPYFPATVREVVASGRTPGSRIFPKMSKSEKSAIESVMEASGISHLQNRLVSDLSGGERQRVFIARALAAEPKMLILDEPTAEVDPASENKLYELLRKLNSMGITIILISHDVSMVANETKSVICVNRHLLCRAKPEDISKNHIMETLYGESIRPYHHKH